MSAKFWHTFSEENSELQKKIGCMTGIFQIFDRQNLLGGRRFKGRNFKDITSGNSYANNVSNPATANVAPSPQLSLEKNLCENQRMSMESSRTSFSSSTCSSFSSIDCNKSNLQDKSVKKESHCLSGKTSYQHEFKQPVLSSIDSPRPIQLSKSGDGSYVIDGMDGTKSRSTLDLNESFKVLMKLKEAPWTFEAKESALNSRFSYDGREISTNCRSNSKFKELPRLSLDSRESSMKISNNGQRDFGSKTSAPSVVAKLMGLEAMPTLSSNHEEQVGAMKNKVINCSNDARTPFESSRNFQKDLNKHSVKNPAKTTMETAPWKKKKERLHVTQNGSKQRSESVYGEIEKRLKEIEFTHASKDLRALKQILDAMQTKGLLESKKNEQLSSPKFIPTRNEEDLRSPIARKPALLASTIGNSTEKAYDSPIVIMKPAKSINRSDFTATSVVHLHGLSRIQRLRTNEVMEKKKEPFSSNLGRDCSPRTSSMIYRKNEENGRIRTEFGLSKTQQSSREKNDKSSNSLSPRLQQRNLEVESRIRSSVTSSDLRKHQNVSTNKQPSELMSPRSKFRRRPTTNQQRDELTQRSGIEDTLAERFACPEQGAQKSSPLGLDDQTSTLALGAVAVEQPSPISVLDATFYQDDLPSLVMVKRSTNSSKGINNSSESHKTHSEINQKKLESIGNLLQKLEELHSSFATASTTTHNITSLFETQNRNHRYIAEILLASGLLMMELGSGPIAPSNRPINPDLFLVLEHTKSIHASNPENADENSLLHHNLDIEKLHRKLVFDVVNELLIQKLEPTCWSSHPWKLQAKLRSGTQLLKQLCSEIDQLQAEALKTEDRDEDDEDVFGEEILRRPPLDWTDYGRELPGIVLAIERSIFKDMIDEIVCVEAYSLNFKSGRRRKHLFDK
ncbi:protein LONGIFOLIA 1 [Phalaenopsis equestris]|uniref:protein LONGIFOLIA 1 n=1 Tax=Phalaenopsis equestris TaxID=78828 RepID=UPI0009E41BBD|nr:protein LONGIFOLIA 1 [Phalaenopsis equestris]XP_020577193.1 protein LONGIFOLIA 1 [Phalaenopsis equestris]XP_020577194.1 protein LONGIFOLIA 1 [Phalaenopsis equestris]